MIYLKLYLFKVNFKFTCSTCVIWWNKSILFSFFIITRKLNSWRQVVLFLNIQFQERLISLPAFLLLWFIHIKCSQALSIIHNTHHIEWREGKHAWIINICCMEHHWKISSLIIYFLRHYNKNYYIYTIMLIVLWVFYFFFFK
jgi:hypothetical protein